MPLRAEIRDLESGCWIDWDVSLRYSYPTLHDDIVADLKIRCRITVRRYRVLQRRGLRAIQGGWLLSSSNALLG